MRQCIRTSGTLRRPNVATSPRRDVPTSRRRRLNVATSQRRDVSASAVFSSFKRKQDGDFEVSGNARTRARKSEQQDIDLEEEPGIYIVSLF